MIVGVTGGIGSGKSFVCSLFKEKGIPVYIADDEAKHIMLHNAAVKNAVEALFGAAAYQNGILNRSYIAEKVFNNTDLLEKLNALVHPAVAAHFDEWYKRQNAPFVIKEAAILFESGSYKSCDVTILVAAPNDVRLKRVQQRDRTSAEAIKARMAKQWPDAQKIPLANFVINNLDKEDTKRQVNDLYKRLIEGV